MTTTSIIGAGITGLTTAIALQKIGHNVSVFEQSNNIKTVGAGLTLWPNATLALQEIGLYQKILDQGFKMTTGSIKKSSGHLIQKINPEAFEEMFGTKTVAIHRAKLHEIFLQSIGEDKVFLNKKLIDIKLSNSNPSAVFEDGSIIQSDFIIGADGIHSTVRQSLFPDNSSKKYSRYGAWRGLVKIESIEDIESFNDYIGEYWGKGLRFGIVQISRTILYWFATVNIPEKNDLSNNDKNNLKRKVEELYNEFIEPIPSIIKTTKPEDLIFNLIYDLKPIKNWFSDKIILIGDAVHAVTPNMGQGACMGIVDGVYLGRLLSNEKQLNNYKELFTKFQKDRQKQTKYVYAQSNRIGIVGQFSNSFFVKTRDLVFRLAPTWIVKNQLEKAMKIPWK